MHTAPRCRYQASDLEPLLDSPGPELEMLRLRLSIPGAAPDYSSMMRKPHSHPWATLAIPLALGNRMPCPLSWSPTETDQR